MTGLEYSVVWLLRRLQMTRGSQEEVTPWSPGGTVAMTRMGYALSTAQVLSGDWRHRPGKKATTIGRDGRKKFTMTKEFFWLCDLGAGGGDSIRLNYPLGHQMPGGRGG